MLIPEFDRGSSIVVEISFKKRTPNISTDLFDPTVPTLVLIGPDGEEIVTEKSLINDAVGKFHYIIQTLETWKIGLYKTIIKADAGSYSDISINENSFRLI